MGGYIYAVSIPYSSGLRFRWEKIGATGFLSTKSQSLIHQVSVSDEVKDSVFKERESGSQSLIHQVSDSDQDDTGYLWVATSTQSQSLIHQGSVSDGVLEAVKD